MWARRNHRISACRLPRSDGVSVALSAMSPTLGSARAQNEEAVLMARLTVGLVFGVVVGIIGGAALQIHAADAGGSAEDVAEAAPEAEPVAVEPQFGIWDRLAKCESNGHWNANTGNGYSGGLQEDARFWARYGGLAYAPAPYLASRAQQIAVAIR